MIDDDATLSVGGKTRIVKSLSPATLPSFDVTRQLNIETGFEEVVTKARVATTYHYHVHGHNHYHHILNVGDNVSTRQKSDADDTAPPPALAVRVVAVSTVLRTAGFVMLAITGFCILGNLTGKTVIIHPFVALSLIVFGTTLTAMSFAREMPVGNSTDVVVR